jgi:hypothetical protein
MRERRAHEYHASSLLVSHGACAARLAGARSKDGGLVCGECKVLVDNFQDTYGGHCTNYCAALGMRCVGAWEEVNDTCEEASAESCDHHMHGANGDAIITSDAICECGAQTQDLASIVTQCAGRGSASEQLHCLLQPQNAVQLATDGTDTLVANGQTITVAGDITGGAEAGLSLGTLLGDQAADPACAACDERATHTDYILSPETVLASHFSLYTFTVASDFAFQASTCSDATNFDTSLLLMRDDGSLVATIDDSVDTCGNCQSGTGQASGRGLGMEVAEIFWCAIAVFPAASPSAAAAEPPCCCNR